MTTAPKISRGKDLFSIRRGCLNMNSKGRIEREVMKYLQNIITSALANPAISFPEGQLPPQLNIAKSIRNIKPAVGSLPVM